MAVAKRQDLSLWRAFFLMTVIAFLQVAAPPPPEPSWMERWTFYIVLVTAVWPIAVWLYRRWYEKPRTFKFRFYSEATRRETTKWTFPSGLTDCEVTIRVRRPMLVRRWNVRPVLTKRGGKVDTDILKVQQYFDSEVPRRSPQWNAQFDNEGGIEVSYTPPAFREPSEPIRFRLSMLASTKPWAGYLRLTSYDEEGETKYSYIKCEVDPTR